MRPHPGCGIGEGITDTDNTLAESNIKTSALPEKGFRQRRYVWLKTALK